MSGLHSVLPNVHPFFSPFRDKDEDEGIPSELEEEKRVMDTKARELKGNKPNNSPGVETQEHTGG